MHEHTLEGFLKQHPQLQSRKLIWTPLTAVGPDEECSVNSHDKLYQAGFAIYGIRDKWGGKCLQYSVVPSNRYTAVVGVLFLLCVLKRSGTSFYKSFFFVIVQDACLLTTSRIATHSAGVAALGLFALQLA